MVSVVGRTTAAATTDRDGRYSLRELPFGPYILSVHSRGYWKSRGRTIQLTTAKFSVPEIQLQLASARKCRRGRAGGRRARAVRRRSSPGSDWTPSRPRSPAPPWSPRRTATEEGETAWRLRHLAAQHSEGRGGRGGLDGGRAGASRDGSAAIRQRARADRVLQRSAVVWPGQPDDDGVVRSSRRDFRRAHSAQRRVRLGQHTGRRRRVGDAGRDDAGRSGVVDCRRAPTSRSSRRTTPTSWGSPTARSGTTAGTRRRSAPFATTPATSAASTASTSGPCRRGSCSVTAPATRATTISAAGVWSPRVSVTCPHRVPAEGAGVAASARARRRGVRAVGDRHVAAAGADVLVALARRPLHARAGPAYADVARARSRAGRDGFGARVRSARRRISWSRCSTTLPGRAEAPLGHYYVGTAGDIDARGWGAAMMQEVPGYVRGTIEYTVTTRALGSRLRHVDGARGAIDAAHVPANGFTICRHRSKRRFRRRRRACLRSIG